MHSIKQQLPAAAGTVLALGAFALIFGWPLPVFAVAAAVFVGLLFLSRRLSIFLTLVAAVGLATLAAGATPAETLTAYCALAALLCIGRLALHTASEVREAFA
jgi:hypothetical protein